MEWITEAGVMARVTGGQTGVLSVGTSIRPAVLVGILVGAGATAPTVQIWQGQATGASSVVIAGITCALNSFTRIPAYCSGGATIYVSGVTTPDLTLFWNPAGGS